MGGRHGTGAVDLGELQERTFARSSPQTRESYPPEHRLDGAALAAYLDRRVFGVLSTARPDGRPHAALTSYVRRSAAFFLPTVAGSVRAANLEHRPWAVLVVAEGDRGDHVAVLVEWPATVVASDAVPTDVAAGETGGWVAAWIRLDARRLLSYRAPGAASG